MKSQLFQKQFRAFGAFMSLLLVLVEVLKPIKMDIKDLQEGQKELKADIKKIFSLLKENKKS